MTVQELITELEKIEDKEQDVFYYEKNWDKEEHPILSDLEIVEPNTYKYVYDMKNGKMDLIGIVIH